MTNATQNERLLLATSTHWIKYVLPSFLYLVMLIGSGVFFLLAGFSAYHVMWLSHAAFLCALALVVTVHHWFFHRLLSEYMMDIVVTDRRVIFLSSSLLLADDMHQVPMSSIQAVNASVHGLLQNVLHYGSLWFDTGGSAEGGAATSIPLVPHPHRVAKLINQTLELR